MGYYFLANIRVTDEVVYQKYLEACDAVFEKYEGTYIAVDEAPRVLEGSWQYTKAVLIYFKTEAAFRAWYDSADYREILKYRLAGAVCDTILIADKAGKTELRRTLSTDPDFLSLIEQLDTELWETYPTLQGSYAKLNVLPDDVFVALLYIGSVPVACGCLRKLAEKTYEVKRMFVRKEQRGKAFAGRILGELEAWAGENGAEELVLETGMKQTAAIGLYEKNGYVRTENYGEYRGNANSVCMKKKLG